MKRTLTDCIPEETICRLTEEAFEVPAAGEKRGRTMPRLLALAASLAIVVTILNFDTVYAAVRELLYFIPGDGPVSQEDSTEYWLPDRDYSAQVGDTSYFVTYLYRRGDTLAIQVEKEIKGQVVTWLEGEEEILTEEEKLKLTAGESTAAPNKRTTRLEGLELEITFLDENGIPLDLEHAHHNSFHVYGEKEAEINEALELSGFTLEKFTLVLDGTIRFPVELRRVDLEDYALTKSTAAEDAGYSLSFLPLNDDCTRFALIPVPVGERAEQTPEGSYWAPLGFAISAVGEDGVTYSAESTNSRPGNQEYYIPGLPETRITKIVVTELLESTRYNKSPASVKLPAMEVGEEQELDQKIDLGNITLTAEAAGLNEEGELWVRISWDQAGGRRLNQLDLKWPEKNGAVSQRLTLEDASQTISAIDDMTRWAGKKVSLPITFVSVVQEGLWEFEVPVAG